MKRTTYIFIAGILLFIAAVFVYNNIENTKAIIQEQQTEKEQIVTPFTLMNGSRLQMQLFALEWPMGKGDIGGNYKGSSSDKVWNGTFKGAPSAFFRVNLNAAAFFRGKEIAFLNDGEAIVYDAEADSLLKASALNRRLFDFQRIAEKFENNNPNNKEHFKNYEEADNQHINYLRTNLRKSYPLRIAFRNQIVDFCNANEDNMLPAYVLTRYAYLFNGESAQALHYKQGVYWNHPMMAHFPNYLRYAKGTPFTDLDLYTLKGENVKLSQWVGKGHYTLVALDTGTEDRDFICMSDAYSRYHQTHGLEIVHIYTGKRYLNWKSLVQSQKMPWVKLSALYYTYNVYKAYAKDSNPTDVILLFDPEGKIVAHNIHDIDIEMLLRNAYGE